MIYLYRFKKLEGTLKNRNWSKKPKIYYLVLPL